MVRKLLGVTGAVRTLQSGRSELWSGHLLAEMGLDPRIAGEKSSERWSGRKLQERWPCDWPLEYRLW